jgi:hypothetical protein
VVVLVLALVVVLLVHDEFTVVVVIVAKVSRSATRVKLPRPERYLVSRWPAGTLGGGAPRRGALALVWHGRDRHAPGVEVPASSRQARIRPWHRPILLPELTRELDADVPSYPRLLAGL